MSLKEDSVSSRIKCRLDVGSVECNTLVYVTDFLPTLIPFANISTKEQES
ncbi:MAG: hypothetical protein QOD17_09765 [Nitrososphaeraceae archaeon]|nr:hypothetical protein [Nitrososphaeraceae archaeon]